MAESYSVKARLSAVDSGFLSTLNKASSSVDSFASKVKSGIGFGVLTGIGQQAFSTLTSGVRDLMGDISSSNAAWKTFSGNMQIFGKSEGEINSVKKELQSFAEQTIYSASDMAQTYAQLSAVGTKNTTQLVKGFGGLASAAENPKQAMKTLSQQATQMAARPNVAWMDFKLMLEQTPAGMAAVAKQMGMTTSELVAGVQAGTITTESFFDAIQKVGTSDSFTKLATQYKTAGQAMDGLKETVSNKLGPAFEVLNGLATNGIGGIIDKLSELDGEQIAKKVSGWVNKVKPYFDSFQKGVQKIGQIIGKVASTIEPRFMKMGSTIGNTVKKVLAWFESINVESVAGKITAFIDSLQPFFDAFKQVGAEVWQGLGAALKAVAGILPKITEFFTKHKDTIAKVMPWILRAVLAFKGFRILQSIIPGFGMLTNAIGGLIKGGIGKLASKFLGTGKAAAVSGTDMAKSASSFLMMGAAVALIGLGFALLARSAIALSEAGGGAIAIMAALSIALIGLTVGMAFLLKMLAPMSAQLIPVGAAFLMLGGAVFLISAGFAILAQSAIALAAAGWPAIAVMVGLVAAIALLAVGAALLGTALTAGAIGFLAFGAAVLMVGAAFLLMGVGAMLGATALQLLALILPTIIACAAQGALALVALGAALVVFGAGAIVAGAGALVLGAGLLVCAAAIAIIAAAFLVIGVATVLAGLGLSLIANTLPLLAANGLKSCVALLALGAAFIVFGAGAIVAGAGAIMLGAGLIVCATAVLMLCAGVLVLAAAVLVLSVGALVAAAALGVLSLALPQLAANGMTGAAAILALGGALLVFAAGAILAGAGALAASIGIGAFGVAMIIAAAGMVIMAGGLKLVTTQMKQIAKNAKSAEKSLKSMRKSVDFVESGLKTIGSIAKSAMSKLLDAFDSTESKLEAAGKRLAEGFINAMKTGFAQAPAMAMAAIMAVVSVLRMGYMSAYAAGAFISQGFANGMQSCLGKVRSAAAKLAEAADKAVRAKAKIGSPSRVADKLGTYWGQGYAGGLLGMVKKVRSAAEKLISVPIISTPDLALAYAGEMSSDYEYYRNAEYTIVVPVEIDGKEVARTTAPYTEAELNRRQTRTDRKNGRR